MTTYRYLGWGKTNSDGIAKLDHNSEGQKIEHSYTGTGAGEIDVLASLDNPVSEGSIVSEPYPVFDCPIYDGDNTPVSINFSKTNNAVVTDEVVSLIASVLNTNNNPCINIPVVFKRGNTVLGTAYTDCTGDATITQVWEDSDIFDVTATVGENLSEDITMFVKDKNKTYLFYDIGVASNYNDDWIKSTDSINVSRDKTGTTISCNSSAVYCANNPTTPHSGWSDTFDWNAPFIIETSIISFENVRLRLYSQTSSVSTQNGIPTGTTFLKVIADGTTIKFYSNNSQTPFEVVNSDFKDGQIGWMVYPSGGNVKYKNFMIYGV